MSFWSHIWKAFSFYSLFFGLFHKSTLLHFLQLHQSLLKIISIKKLWHQKLEEANGHFAEMAAFLFGPFLCEGPPLYKALWLSVFNLDGIKFRKFMNQLLSLTCIMPTFHISQNFNSILKFHAGRQFFMFINFLWKYLVMVVSSILRS